MREPREVLEERYRGYQRAGIRINMERGWPCREQLELSAPMLDMVGSGTDLEREVDYRGYAGTGGIDPLKGLFADILEVSPKEIYIGGTMSTTLMYDIVSKAVLFGLEGHRPWGQRGEVSFICPVPGYEKHFRICETFGIRMIPVRMLPDGPDMDEVERIAGGDGSVRGIWCVPLYSNPTGAVYSDAVVRRLARMHTAAEDFRIFWDNAYCVHHLTDEKCRIRNIIRECEAAGCPDRAFEFASTSKITFPGGGVGLCASSERNIAWLTASSLLQLKSGDKINQLRHFLFLRDADGVDAHMKRHREVLAPKFDMVDAILHEELDGWDMAEWEKPKGGYFFSVRLRNGMARAVCQACEEAGVMITPAGSTFPYGNDPEDAHLRIAPTYPPMKELELAMRILCVSVKLVGTDRGDESDVRTK